MTDAPHEGYGRRCFLFGFAANVLKRTDKGSVLPVLCHLFLSAAHGSVPIMWFVPFPFRLGASMQNVAVAKSVPSCHPSIFGSPTVASGGHHHHLHEERQNLQFIALLDSYRDCGGLGRASEVVALLNRRSGANLPTLATWIAGGEVMSLEWQSQTWLPLFQFNRLDMTPQPELALIFAELAPVLDAWELASWFAQPNAWLADRTPAAMIVLDLPAVLNASRADRFIFNG